MEHAEPDTRLADSVRLRNAMKALQASEGWKIFVTMLNGQRENIANELLRTPMKPDLVYAQEFDKGQIAGMWRALDLPRVMLEEAEAVIQGLQTPEDADAA